MSNKELARELRIAVLVDAIDADCRELLEESPNIVDPETAGVDPLEGK